MKFIDKINNITGIFSEIIPGFPGTKDLKKSRGQMFTKVILYWRNWKIIVYKSNQVKQIFLS